MNKITFKQNITTIIFLVFALTLISGTIIGKNNIAANVKNTQVSVDDKGSMYSVHKLTYNGSKKEITYSPSLLTTDDFNVANNKLKDLSKNESNFVIKSSTSPSPEKIVAADRAYVQTYPYRKGSKFGPAQTMNYYRDKGLVNGKSYVAAHYLMQYYGTEIYNNKMIFNIELAGKKGYSEADKGDIIPMLYVDEKVPFTMGGNESFYASPEKPYSIVVKPVEYKVTKDKNGYNELSLHYHRTYPAADSSPIRYALAPEWLPIGTYYSADGIKFYKDIDLKQEYSKGKEFYAYYQWLPIKSRSNYNGDDFKKVMFNNGHKSTAVTNKEHSFRDAGDKYGINPLLLFSQAMHESGWATSKIARNYNNLFGWGAVDSNPSNAKEYDNVLDSIEEQAGAHLKNYTRPGYSFHYGPSFGNKDSGISVLYASDPYYGEKVAGVAYSADKLLGFKDYNAYELNMTPDNVKTPVYKDTSGKNEWYKTEGSPLSKQMIVNLGNTGAYTKTYLYTSVFNGNAVLNYDPNFLESDLTKEFAYVLTSSLRKVDTSNQIKGKINSPRIPTSNPIKQYFLNSDTDLKSAWQSNSETLSLIPKGTKVDAWDAPNGWLTIHHKGKFGYIQKSSVVDKEPEQPIVKKTIHYVKLPDSLVFLNIRESSSTESKIIGSLKHGEQIMASKFNNSWYEIEVRNNKVGYVHADYVSKTKPSDPGKPVEPPKIKKGDVNKDGVIDGFDMMEIKRHYLNTKKLTGDNFKAADVNEDGVVDGFDMMAIKRHYLGTKLID